MKYLLDTERKNEYECIFIEFFHCFHMKSDKEIEEESWKGQYQLMKKQIVRTNCHFDGETNCRAQFFWEISVGQVLRDATMTTTLTILLFGTLTSKFGCKVG